MGVKRRAKAGHYYSRRRTRSGRYYTVSRGSDASEAKTTIWVVALLAGIFIAPFTYLTSIPIALMIAFAATASWQKGTVKEKAPDRSDDASRQAWLEKEWQKLNATCEDLSGLDSISRE